MKTTLYNIEQKYLELINEIELNEGEITPEVESALQITEKELQSKSLSYYAVIQSKESLNDKIDAEIKRLQAMKKQNNNIVSYLKDRLLNAVKMFGEFNVGLVKFGTRKSTSVKVEDVNSLPNDYKVVKLTEQADKAEIKKALKSGVEIEGCELVENLNLKIN